MIQGLLANLIMGEAAKKSESSNVGGNKQNRMEQLLAALKEPTYSSRIMPTYTQYPTDMNIPMITQRKRPIMNSGAGDGGMGLMNLMQAMRGGQGQGYNYNQEGDDYEYNKPWEDYR